jgi:hypothetical protein
VQGDQIAALVEMHANPSRVPDGLTLRRSVAGLASPAKTKPR